VTFSYAHGGCNVTIETTRGSNGKWTWSARIGTDSSKNVEKIVLPVEYDRADQAFDDAKTIAQRRIDDPS
jgi:hypothetical protein